MQGKDFIDRLRKNFDCERDADLANKLSVKSYRIAQLKRDTDISERKMANFVSVVNTNEIENQTENSAGNTFDGINFVEQLKNQFGCNNDADLARTLLKTAQTIYGWKQNTNLSPLVIARIIKESTEASYENGKRELNQKIEENISNAIKTIIEYIPIRPVHKSGQKSVTIQAADGYGHLRIRGKIENKNGIYIFYNSSCCPVYVGKAKHTKLWAESNSAYCRVYKGQFYGVNYSTEYQKQRETYSLSKRDVNLYDIVSYYSAYEVNEHLIDKVEALLIRSFINDLSNVKVESLDNV